MTGQLTSTLKSKPPSCEGELPARLRQVLKHVSTGHPAQAEAMSSALPVAMAPLCAATDCLPTWRLSLLTSDGYPFEITFATQGDALRCTMEVSPPQTPTRGRLEQVLAVLTTVGTNPRITPEASSNDVLAWLARLQQCGTLAFGAWAGLHFDAAGNIGTKVYAEIPPEAQDHAIHDFSALIDSEMSLPMRIKSLRMIGFSPADGGIEAYYSIINMCPWELGSLMSPLGLLHRAPEVLGRFEAALGRHLHQKFPTPIFGFSYALLAGQTPVFSLYTFTEHLFGADAITRRKVLSLMERIGEDLGPYAPLSEPLADEFKTAHGHGLFGVAVTQDGPPIIHLGLRPPSYKRRG